MKSVVSLVALLPLVCAACSAPATNPDRAALEAVTAKPAPAAGGAAQAAAPAASAEAAAPSTKSPTVASERGAASESGSKTETAPRPEAAAAAPAAAVPAAAAPDAAKRPEPPTLAVAYVDGRPLDVRRFLGRVWLRDSSFAREVLDQLVVAELAIREADRLGVRVDPARVDAGVQRALDALARRLEEKGTKLTVEEHVRQNLGLDFALYRTELERDALMQLLAERCVRSFALACERAVVRLAELQDRATLDAFQAELAAGGDFAALVQKHGTSEIKQGGGGTLTLFQNDNSKLSRLVFATPVGTVGGPLEEGGRFLLARVEDRLAPKVGPWTEIGPLVEASLASDPVDDLEYAQWKTHVGKVYDVDLAPFLELVGEKRP